MNVSPKVLHLSILLAMTLPAMAQTTLDKVQSAENGMPYASVLEARDTLQHRTMLLSEDKLQTQDRLRIQDKLYDQDQLQTQDRDRLQTRDQDKLQTPAQDGSGSGKQLQKQQKHEIRNMFQYEERESGQGFSTGGSMNRRMNSVGSGSSGGGGGRR